jgi:hypothetical protein
MRKTLLLIVATASIFLTPPLAEAGTYRDGSYIGRPSTVVTGLYAQFPQGGEALAEAIAALLIDNPSLADDVAYVAVTSANTSQQAAAGVGMAQAASTLADSQISAAAGLIARAAADSGSPALAQAAAASNAAAAGGVAASLYLPTNNATTVSAGQNCVTIPGDNTVSPATPPTTVCH